MINDFIKQCQSDEDRGLLPKGYTEEIKKRIGATEPIEYISENEKEELIAGENKYNLNGDEL